MLGDELLIAQLRDVGRVAAGLHAVAVIGEQPGHHGPLQHPGRVGEGSLHFVVNNALKHGLPGVVKFQPPALLPEHIGAFHRRGMQHRVQVDLHQVAEILPVPAAHGVDGLVRVGHGIEEGLQGAFQQLHKGLLDGIAVAARQHGVLQDMKHAGGVGGDGAQAHGKGHIFVLPLKPHQLRAALPMLHLPERPLHLLDLSAAQQGKMIILNDLLYHKWPPVSLYCGIAPLKGELAGRRPD